MSVSTMSLTLRQPPPPSGQLTLLEPADVLQCPGAAELAEVISGMPYLSGPGSGGWAAGCPGGLAQGHGRSAEAWEVRGCLGGEGAEGGHDSHCGHGVQSPVMLFVFCKHMCFIWGAVLLMLVGMFCV